MSDSEKDEVFAFPFLPPDGPLYQTWPASAGMTLRDYFAAKALPSALAEFYQGGEVWADHDDLAQHIYNVADAMLRAREAK